MIKRDNKYVWQIERGEDHLDAPEWAAKEILTNMGFSVREVPRTSKKTPDYLVDGDDPAYVVEVASRHVSDAAWKQPITLDMQSDPKVREWLREACLQCRTVDPDHNRLWIVWGAAEGPIGARDQLLRVRNTLFGVRGYQEIVPPHRSVIACYAHAPLFEDFTDIDAVFAFVDDAVGTSACLLPNEFSPRFGLIRASKFTERLTAMGGTLGTSEMHAQHGGCVVPNNIDREDQSAVLRYVQATLGIPMLTPNAAETKMIQLFDFSDKEPEDK